MKLFIILLFRVQSAELINLNHETSIKSTNNITEKNTVLNKCDVHYCSRRFLVKSQHEPGNWCKEALKTRCSSNVNGK